MTRWRIKLREEIRHDLLLGLAPTPLCMAKSRGEEGGSKVGHQLAEGRDKLASSHLILARQAGD